MATPALTWRRPMADEEKNSSFHLQSFLQFLIGILTVVVLLGAIISGINSNSKEINSLGTELKTLSTDVKTTGQDTRVYFGQNLDFLARMLEYNIGLPQSKANREKGAILLKEIRQKQDELKRQQDLITNGNGPPQPKRKE